MTSFVFTFWVSPLRTRWLQQRMAIDTAADVLGLLALQHVRRPAYHRPR